MGRMVFFAGGVWLGVEQLVLLSPLLLASLTALLVLGYLYLKGPWAALIGCFVLGFVWLQIHGHWRLAKALPSELHRVEILCEGRVLSPPELGALRWRFEFRLQRCQGEHGWQQMGQRLRLGWYRPSDHLSPPRGGEQWRLALKLKLPRGQLNPDGFDYETWLFQRGFQGTGYVSDAQASYRMSAAPWWSLAHWRTELRDRLHNKLPDTSAAGVIPALVLADRSGIEPALWNRFREAGTGHLLAISGLHVGLVAAFGALCGALFWRLVGARFGSRAIWVGGCALAVASGYSALAGFALPTVRALVMLMAVAVFSALGRHRRGMDILGFAFVALLVFDPLSILSAGFWLSFCSVAGIVFGLSTKHHWKPWQQLLWVNAAMGLVLAPLSHLLFGQLAWWCSPANLVVVPVFSFVVVPLSLLGASLAVLDLSGAQSLLSWAAIGITWCDAWQSWLLKLPKPQLPMVGWAPVGLLLLSVGLLLPKLWRGSATLLVAAVVLLISPRQSELPTEGFELTTFDVGHGLAVMVETKEHLLIYDTGPRYGYGRSSGDAVIAPAIRGGGWLAPDIIMVSHEDGDHAGGLPSLERAFGGAEIIRGQSASCAPGRHWSWDGVHFEILHPVATWSGDNDNSCVLRVSSGLGSALLPGDIERRAERRMLERRLEMRSQLLLVPHHGSNSSSSASWLEVVKPELAVISVASDSRWGMPHAPVLQRLQRVGAQVLSTGESGAIVVRFDGSAAAPSVRLIREERRRFWHRP